MRYFSLLLLMITLTSCLEGDDDSFQQTSSVLFVNVYNDAPDGVDFRINDREWTYGRKPYDLVDTYNAFYSEDVTFSAFPVGAGSAQPIATLSQALEADMDYTCFLTGKSGEAKMFILPDTLRAPAARTALIRFVNLSPDLPRANVELVDSGEVISNLDYLNAGFMTLDTGTNVIRVQRPGNKEPLASLIFRPTSGAIYTMYTKGLLDRTGKDSLAIRYFSMP